MKYKSQLTTWYITRVVHLATFINYPLIILYPVYRNDDILCMMYEQNISMHYYNFTINRNDTCENIKSQTTHNDNYN